jgi:uncharacterized membrane protein YcaP (DUF421 family)
MADLELGFLAAVAARTAIVLVFLVIGLRLTGRRQAGELNLRDLLLVLILANAVQNAMTKGDGRLSVAIVSAGTLLLLGTTFAALQSRYPELERLVVGVPVVLAEDGRPLRANMQGEGVSRDELMAAVRDQGLADLSDVRLAVLEPDGAISVIPRESRAAG